MEAQGSCASADEVVTLASQERPMTPSCRRDLGFLLGVLLREYHQSVAGLLADIPAGARGFQLLLAAGEGVGRNQATLAAQLGLDRTVVTYLIDELVDAGLVERRPDPSDRRARLIALTTTGQETLQRLSSQLRQLERNVFKALDDQEMQQLTGLLDRAGATWIS
jgi:DNA-binding MarR family transcriptional regulator